MKTAADFKRLALDALKGKWALAILVGLVAFLFGADMADVSRFRLNIDISNADVNIQLAGHTILSTSERWTPAIGMIVFSAVFVVLAAIALALLFFVLGSFVQVGYAKFNLNLVSYKSLSFETLFGFWTYWKTTAVASLLRGIYVFLWSLLLVIPGIMASYSYAMTDYFLAENPELTASEAIALSKEMMAGNRWRLFCLHFSFIGWEILCAFTAGIGYLWLRPYKHAAAAAFYREVSGLEYAEYTETSV